MLLLLLLTLPTVLHGQFNYTVFNGTITITGYTGPGGPVIIPSTIATNALLELTSVQPVQAGTYTVVVTNMGLAVTSAPALLAVIPPVVATIVAGVSLTGGTRSLLHLEYAGSLANPHWFSLSDVTLGDGPQFYFDPGQPLPAQRFYRAWQTNGPQPALGATMATQIPLAGTIGSSVRVDYIEQLGPTDAWVTLEP